MKIKIILPLLLLIIVSSLFFILGQKEKAQLSLDGFYNLTLKDPLFYSSFLNPDEFKKAIGGLEESESRLKKVLMEGGEITASEEVNFFPIQFLKDLVLINQKTNEFLKEPSINLAEDLLDNYDAATDSYLQGISSLIRSLEKKEEMALFFVDSASSSEIIKNDFLVIRENGYKLKEEIEKRRKCLTGAKDCHELLTTRENDFRPVTDEEFDLEGEKINFIKSVLPYREEGEIKGPYKVKSFCWQNPNFEHWVYLIYAEQEGKVSVLPKSAEQNYYRKIPLQPHTEEQAAILKRGLEFVSQIETMTYQCTDLTFYPKLLVMDFITEQIKNGRITESELEEELDYKLLMENQFGLLAPAINTLARHINTLIQYTETYESTTSFRYVILARTAYSMLYFPFAKSIWRTEENMQYFLPRQGETSENETGKYYFTFDQLKGLGYTNEEIASFHLIPQEIFAN